MRAGGGGLALLLTVAVISAAYAQGEPRVGQHNIGCLFSPAVCLQEVEWCFDDYAFGQCLPHGVDANSLFRYSLDREELHLLQRDMEKLFSMGYRWAHLYTQCVLQLKLQAIKEEEEYDKELCGPLADQDLDSALKAFQGEEENLGPSQVAHVKYMPSSDDFADEVYSPADEIVSDEVEGFPENVIKGQGDEYRKEEPSMRKILLGREGVEKREQWGERDEPHTGVYPIERYLYNSPQSESDAPHFSKTYNTPDGFRMGIEAKDLAQALASQLKTFNRAYNTPDSFRLGIETKDFNDDESNEDNINEQVFESPAERELIYDAYRADMPNYVRTAEPGSGRDEARGRGRHRMEDRLTHDLELLADDSDENDEEADGRVFTEGGIVEIPDDEKAVSDELVRDYAMSDGWGFKRRERLDVKKPGPHFNLNNFAFQTQQPKASTAGPKPAPSVAVAEKPLVKKLIKSVGQMKPARTAPVGDLLNVRKKGVGSPKGSPNLRKASAEDADADVAFIKFKNGVDKWTDGVTILRFAAKHLGFDPNAFVHSRVEDNGVYFRVDRTKADISASEMAQRIDGIKDIIKKELEVEVTATGSNEKSRSSGQPVELSLTTTDERELWLLSFLLCGVIAAVAIGGAAFFFVRRHSQTKDKLSGLKQPDAEASKDYQELCRARMASKTADKPETAAMRMGSTSGEPKSPSSRSSTSSWSEEPAVSNMDISTGHMVLSYMEDHLKNKDRLEQEWVALCAYEAEPCAVTVASSENNLKKNRYPDMLPYDHSRVLLNQLLNINGSDYINASTINDHDPRNAAYIATQGPLESTTADLWQMLWEQGSVVMVMLTRLSENGNTLCHRYWPDEGSQIYHIYEVHLVSEHIWCDDYLVRSFYLKNLKTGETRTVTQFHFLSWPENGVPLSTKALLEFRRKVNKSYRGRSCPIVVHCSDGVGRSGTYCLIDMVLNRMAKGAKEIDIAATLEHIRDQRPFMVKTKQQFEFVLMAVAEEVHAILKAMPATHSPPPVAATPAGAAIKDKEKEKE